MDNIALQSIRQSTTFIAQPASNVLRPPWGSVKLIFTKFINLVVFEQCHHIDMEMYAGGLLKVHSYTENKAGAIIFGVGAIFANGS